MSEAAVKTPSQFGSGGGSSSISLTASASVSANIVNQSYANLTGDAIKSLSISSANGTWTGTTVKLLTSGGVVAGTAAVDVRVFETSNPSTTYGGPVTAPFTP